MVTSGTLETGKPRVGIVMGSDSDMPVMAKAADILEELGIPYEMAIISASAVIMIWFFLKIFFNTLTSC